MGEDVICVPALMLNAVGNTWQAAEEILNLYQNVLFKKLLE